MTKIQAGLDSSTLADWLNCEEYAQVTGHFGIDDHSS